MMSFKGEMFRYSVTLEAISKVYSVGCLNYPCLECCFRKGDWCRLPRCALVNKLVTEDNMGEYTRNELISLILDELIRREIEGE